MIRLRVANVGDIPTLKKWDADVEVWMSGGADGAFDWDTEVPRFVDWREMLVAEQDGRPIGFIQICDATNEETHYWGDIGLWAMAIDIWIGDSADRNHGYGSQMMKLAIDRCFAHPDTAAIFIDPLDSNVRACRFYERLGFKFVEKRKFGHDLCRVYRIDRSE